jgi:hypothetical protein
MPSEQQQNVVLGILLLSNCLVAVQLRQSADAPGVNKPRLSNKP